ncbi:unnamed protein product, partial [Rotaria sp. Silwood1]
MNIQEKHTLFIYFQTNEASDDSTWCVNDDESDSDESSLSITSHGGAEDRLDSKFSTMKLDTSDDVDDVKIDDYLDPQSDTSHQSLSTKILKDSETSEDAEVAKALLESLQKEIENLKSARDKENEKIASQLQSSEKKSHELEEKLAQTCKRADRLNEELQKLKKKEEKIKEIANKIQTVKYKNIEKSILYDFIIPKQESIIDHLQRTIELDKFFNDNILKMTFKENNNTFVLTITGMQAHHQAFKEILKRVITLSTIKQRAIEFYQRYLRRITTSINKILFRVQPNTKYWKQYSQFLY